jgi:hypothetical protein
VVPAGSSGVFKGLLDHMAEVLVHRRKAIGSRP